MSASHVIWYSARASGYTALVMLTLSMVMGLVLSLRLHSPRWPRFVTTELHRFVTLTALVFVGLHTVAVYVDPYMRFSAAAVLVPFHSPYRPLGMALGITASWLLLAVWISSQLQRRIGWRSWRRLHYGAFAVYALAVVHTIVLGEDTTSAWGRWLVIGSVLVVTCLAAARALDRRLAPVPAPPSR